MIPRRILAIDVGAGTQDILLWEADQPMENCVKLVLPSWTTILARRAAATGARTHHRRGAPVHHGVFAQRHSAVDPDRRGQEEATRTC